VLDFDWNISERSDLHLPVHVILCYELNEFWPNSGYTSLISFTFDQHLYSCSMTQLYVGATNVK